MKNVQNILLENDAILAEILIAPSLVCIENRFAGTTDAADCSGKCDSGGGCRAM